jgi:hypothetical protein
VLACFSFLSLNVVCFFGPYSPFHLRISHAMTLMMEWVHLFFFFLGPRGGELGRRAGVMYRGGS